MNNTDNVFRGAQVFDISTLRVAFSKGKKIADKEWLRQMFTKIVEVIIKQSVSGDRIDLMILGEVIECEIAKSPESLKNNPCYTLSQVFNGAIFMLKTEPATNSLILFLGGFPEINCGKLNGEVKGVLCTKEEEEDVKITRADSSAPYC
jgi:hypothetical protein